MGISMNDYVDVAERIVEFRTKYPDGSLQPNDRAKPFEVLTIGDQTFICVVAAAYRHPTDPLPGIGMAYEVFPGKTNFTRGSELQNAETSAWGRAILAALAADTKRGIASRQEVQNRAAEREQAPQQGQRLGGNRGYGRGESEAPSRPEWDGTAPVNVKPGVVSAGDQVPYTTDEMLDIIADTEPDDDDLFRALWKKAAETDDPDKVRDAIKAKRSAPKYEPLPKTEAAQDDSAAEPTEGESK